MKEKKDKNLWTKMKDMYHSPRGKAILFFVFYFFFFLALSLISHVNNNSDTVGSNQEINYHLSSFSFQKLEAKNYHFLYQISINNQMLSYEGDKNKNQELFTSTKNNMIENYYRKENTYLKNTDSLWLKVENPYIFSNFLDASALKNILEKASYISKTDYESGKQVYRFAISTATLVSLFEEQEIDIADDTNEIIVSTDEEKNINEINYQLDAYGKYQKISTTHFQITLKFSSFGTIPEISNPLG